jgi:hypothetical protein
MPEPDWRAKRALTVGRYAIGWEASLAVESGGTEPPSQKG